MRPGERDVAYETALALWRERYSRWVALPDDEPAPDDLFSFDILAMILGGPGEDEPRIRAARRIRLELKLKIHPGRRVDLGIEQREELIQQALFEVATDGVPGGVLDETAVAENFSVFISPEERPAVLKMLRLAVIERLTQDARGPAWRATEHELRDADALVLAAAPTAERADLGVLEAIERANLSKQQSLVIEALLAADAPQDVIAARIGMARGTFSAHLHRARKKIRSAM